MPTRLPSDSETVETARAELVRLGSARRQGIRLPEAASDELDADDVIRLVFDDTEHHAVVAEDSRGLVLHGAYDNRRLARSTGEGDNRLAAWLRDLGRESGNSVAFDTVVDGEQYGLRTPGERAIYTVRQGPRDSLAGIAEDLDG
ncbi:DUF7112 family protein [Halohasta salina]|uniref:DUF7112 family protein n=1 Tax=Halohasta salina TaxID=2961621 RepID=UPI0020A37D58|nr:hypothetical protein [Halohasta salina]